MPSFKPKFLGELKAALTAEGRPDLATQVEHLQAHELVEGHRPISLFIYVVPRASLPAGELPRLIPDGVPGLFSLFLHRGRIAAVETLSRDVLMRAHA